jgi:AraC-like DNA-binding protein
MRAADGVTWEHVSSLVDRQINAEHFHIWPFPHSCPVDVRFLILDRRHDVPMHRPDHLEVVVFESGEIGYEFENRTFTLRKSDILVAGDRIRHRCLAVRNSQREARSVVLSFLPKLVECGAPLGDDAQYLMPFRLLNASFPNVIPAGTGLAREILDFINRIHRELPGASDRSRLAIKTYLKMILLALVNHYSELGATRRTLLLRQSDVRRLGPALEHIGQHYHERIRVNDAAKRCAMSDCSFMHFFKEVTGQSFVAYLNCFRVARAQQLLASTEKAIVDISLEVGFCNQSYFGAVFRRITGMTPLEYRLQHKKARIQAINGDSLLTVISL